MIYGLTHILYALFRMDPNTERALALSLESAKANNQRRRQGNMNLNQAIAESISSEEQAAIRRRHAQTDINAALAASIYTDEIHRATLASIAEEFKRQMKEQSRASAMPTILTRAPIEGVPVSPKTLAAIEALNTSVGNISPRTQALINESNARAAAAAAAKQRLHSNFRITANELSRRRANRGRLGAAPAGLRPVRIKDAGGAGDCFYLSLVAALTEQGLVDLVRDCLGVQPSADRLLFTGGIRNLIAESLHDRAGLVYDYLTGLVDRHASAVERAVQMETQRMIMGETFALWHRLAFYNARDRADYIGRIRSGVRVRGNWASEIEVKTLVGLLQVCGIDLVVYNNNRAGALSAVEGGRHKVYLYNAGNVHFQYFSFSATGGRKTRRGHKGGWNFPCCRRRRGTNKANNKVNNGECRPCGPNEAAPPASTPVATTINAANDTFPLYYEPQKGSLCAKHALNHLLQEGKIVFMPGRDLYYNSQTKADSAAADILDKDIHLNFWKYCDVKDAEQMAQIGEIADPTCSAQHDNLTFDRLEELVSLFGYKAVSSRVYRSSAELEDHETEQIRILYNSDGNKLMIEDPDHPGQMIPKTVVERIRKPKLYPVRDQGQIRMMTRQVKTTRPEFWQEIKEKLQEMDLLGVLINKGAWHYTAISKFMKGCSRWERNATRRLRSVSYAYIDTIPSKTQECLNLDAMINYLQRNSNIDSVIYVYDQPGAYNSVAASRLRKLQVLPGGRRTRK